MILPVIGSLPDVLKAGVFSEICALKTVNGLPGSRPKKQNRAADVWFGGGRNESAGIALESGSVAELRCVLG